MAFLELVDISQKIDSSYLLRGVNLAVERGEVFAIIGPTGAGKSTLIRLVDLLDKPESGRIIFDGIDVTRSNRERFKVRRRMGYVQQKPIVFTLNVYDNVALGLKWRREQRGTIRRKVMEALELVDMAEYRSREARTLSGGETQRVAIARALVTEPELLLLDEPTANLDPRSTEKVEEVLANVMQARPTTVIMATHDMSQGQRLASRMGVLMDGEMLQVGTPAEVFRSPGRRRVADFVGVGNMLAGTVRHKLDEGLVIVELEGGKSIEVVAEVEVGMPVWALIRTEDVTFSLISTSTSARNLFQGEITRMTPRGTLVRIEIDCGFPLVGVVTSRSQGEMEMRLGKRLFASFKATAIQIIRRRK